MKFEDYYVNLSQPDENHLVNMLNTNGFATFEQMFPDDNTNDELVKDKLVDLVRKFGTTILHPDADSRGVTSIAPEKDSNRGLGFGDKRLYPHTDRSSEPEPAPLFLFYCHKPAPIGGETQLLDGKKLYETLDMHHPALLKELLSSPAIFGDPNHSDKHYVDSIFSQDENGIITVRFRYDSAGYYPAPMGPELEKLLQIMDELCTSFKLDSGQGYIVNNRRCLHGRTEFTDELRERKMYRIFFDFYPTSLMSQEITPGFKAINLRQDVEPIYSPTYPQ